MFFISRDEEGDWLVVSAGESYDTIISKNLSKNQAACIVHFLNGGNLISHALIQSMIRDAEDE